jgi:surface polysaccharide O-acyltransferase-like enzyme
LTTVTVTDRAVTSARVTRTNFLRGGGIALVVFIHASSGPEALDVAALTPSVRVAAGVAVRLATSLAVPIFLLLAFMQLHPTLAGRQDLRRLARRCARILPVYLFWTAVYAVLKLTVGGVRPTAGLIAEYVFLGKAAAHLYFLPLLVVLTASLPIWLWIARRRYLAIAAAAALPLGTSYLDGLPGLSVWAHSLLGILGNSVYAIAALAIVERWGGWEPAGASRRRTLLLFSAAALASGIVLAAHGAAEGLSASPLSASWLVRAARVAFPISTACAVLASRAHLPEWTAPLAPLTLGIYVVHPLLLQPLRMLEARVPLLGGHSSLLAVPNSIVVLAATVAIVLTLMNTRLRKVLA